VTPDLLSSENLRKEGTAEDRIDMLRLNSGARVMLADSGGLQEEYNVPQK